MKISLGLAVRLLASFIALGLAAHPALAQQPTTDRVAELQQKLEALEQQVQNRQTSMGEVLAVGEMARMTMNAYESKFDLIKTGLSVIVVFVGIVVGGFALFGYREWTQFTKPLKDEHEKLRNQIEDERGKLATLQAECGQLENRAKETAGKLDVIKGDAEKNFKALPYMMSAFTYAYALGKDMDLRDALKDLNKVINDIKPVDPKILAWAYGMQGYVLRRLVGAKEALKSIERSIELNSDNARSWYNGACYAALIGDKTESFRYLAGAIQRDPLLTKLATGDPDFNTVKEDTEFKRLTALG